LGSVIIAQKPHKLLYLNNYMCILAGFTPKT
jgi:hypothetical protein